MRQLRDARAAAEALEHYLATLNPAYRQAAGAEARREKLKKIYPSCLQGTHGSRGSLAILPHLVREPAPSDGIRNEEVSDV